MVPSNPEVEVTDKTMDGNLTLSCEFSTVQDSNDTLEYHVYWVKDSVVIDTKVLNDTTKEIKVLLDRKHVADLKFGTKVGREVYVRQNENLF